MIRYDYEGMPFHARDGNGRQYLLTPLYRLKATDAGWQQEDAPEFCTGLRTEFWQWVAREAKGRYFIIDTNPPTPLISDDPRAV